MKNPASTLDALPGHRSPVPAPRYLTEHYWWAYVHPNAVRLFERGWLVNLILWGHYATLRDAAVAALGTGLAHRTLQVACVYGNLTARVLANVGAGGRLDVVDVLPIQLDNLERKLGRGHGAHLLRGDSEALPLPDGGHERVLLFFLLHEQPDAVRRRTLAEALRVLRPGGRVVLVDYHQPHWWHPLRWPMAAVLALLEPFALGLWRTSVADLLPEGSGVQVETRTFFGGLYQLTTLVKPCRANAA